MQKDWNFSSNVKKDFKLKKKRSRSAPRFFDRDKIDIKNPKKKRRDIKSRSYFNGFFRVSRAERELGEEFFKLKNQRIIDKKMTSFEFFKKKG